MKGEKLSKKPSFSLLKKILKREKERTFIKTSPFLLQFSKLNLKSTGDSKILKFWI
jgi:hypothetical protein